MNWQLLLVFMYCVVVIFHLGVWVFDYFASPWYEKRVVAAMVLLSFVWPTIMVAHWFRLAFWFYYPPRVEYYE
jgi:hypothetical protein